MLTEIYAKGTWNLSKQINKKETQGEKKYSEEKGKQYLHHLNAYIRHEKYIIGTSVYVVQWF